MPGLSSSTGSSARLQPSKSQKRLWSKGKHLRWEIRSQLDEKVV
ncbi:hypothetical protein JCM19239_6247 [Vibrio variabilis]|uniref:Uncharacterized protein n=1 Tax=Vibrio variabilis TaxID=990271 RepID=A0ABQ0J9D7_9VIBR|nr:hypothetical protein JCM19239_6247 [Vibrio variabilis]